MPLLSFWAKVVGSTVVFVSILSVQSRGVLAWEVCLILYFLSTFDRISYYFPPDSLQPSLSALEAQQVASGFEAEGKKPTEEEDPSTPSGKIASSAPVLAGKTSTSQQRSTAWEHHRGTDCYEGKGGQPLSPDPYHRSLTLAQCQAACAQDSACKGVIRKAGEQTGICYRRRGIQLANCAKDSTWDLFIKKDSTTGGKGIHKFKRMSSPLSYPNL